MVKLFVFGSPFAVADDGSRLDELVRQKKRLGLLAYLGCGARAAHWRDELLATFWPESDDDSARNCLRQCLHLLRGQLGEGVILGKGDQKVALAADRLETDVGVFERSLASGCQEAAIDLYRGDFLQGFHLADAPKFERWVEARRACLRGLAVQAGTQLAHAAERVGDLAEALCRWRWVAELSPFDESVVRQVASLLLASGNRAEAVLELDRFQALLRRELEVEPSRATLQLLREAHQGTWPRSPLDTDARRSRVTGATARWRQASAWVSPG